MAKKQSSDDRLQTADRRSPAPGSKKVKLNLGCGNHRLDGYHNIDIQGEPRQKAFPLWETAESFDEIRASHLLEHFGYEQTADVLADWVSKLKPGGLLKIAVPDFDGIVKDYLDYENGVSNQNTEPWLLGSHADEYDFHKAVFTCGKLMQQMQNAGLVNVRHWESLAKDSASLDISLNLMGEKKAAVDVIDELIGDKEVTSEKEKDIAAGDKYDLSSLKPLHDIKIEHPDGTLEIIQGSDKSQYNTECVIIDEMSLAAEKARRDALAVNDAPIRIQAVMSMPRLAFTENMFCAMSAFHPLGINIERATGAFWEHGLTRMMEKFTNDGFDYLIAIDFDTYYTEKQVTYLCQLAVSNPDVDAIVSLQAKREDDLMLMGWKTPDGMDPSDFLKNEIATKELVDIVTGHFGLTIIKCDALKTIGKPWFNSTPGPDGSWNDGRVDSDISFWHNMKRCGKKVCLAPKIKIGHLQQMMTLPGTLENGLHPEHYYITDINKNGLPGHCKI